MKIGCAGEELGSSVREGTGVAEVLFDVVGMKL